MKWSKIFDCQIFREKEIITDDQDFDLIQEIRIIKIEKVVG